VLRDPVLDAAALDDPASAGLVVWPVAGLVLWPPAGLELRPFDGGELDAEEPGVDGLTLGRVYFDAVILGLAAGEEDVGGADAVGVGLAHVAVGTVFLLCAALRLAVSDGVVVVAVPVVGGVVAGVVGGVVAGVVGGVVVGVVGGVVAGVEGGVVVAVLVGVPPLLVPPAGLVAEPAGVTLGVTDLLDLACDE
jgi:hypothetical protein